MLEIIQKLFNVDLRPRDIKALKRALERTCYVAGAGAFGVFVRWLQDQMAFTADGLAEKSFFHVFVVLYILAMGLMFLRFVDVERSRYIYLPEEFENALVNPGGIYATLRWIAGILVCVGAIALYASAETDEEVKLLRVLAGLGFVYGASFPYLLGAANKPLQRHGLLCVISCLPVLFFALWLVISYKLNAINSVVWGYVIEMLAIVAAMAAFFRLAGFLFDTTKGWHSMFTAMFGAACCIMTLADDRYMGMQLMFLGTACLLLLCSWIMFYNLKQGKVPEKPKTNDGFERL